MSEADYGYDPIQSMRDLHARYRSMADLGDPSSEGMPEGWRFTPCRWGWRCWSGYITPPPNTGAGWRLADPFAKSERKARRRARLEIEQHLARREARPPQEETG